MYSAGSPRVTMYLSRVAPSHSGLPPIISQVRISPSAMATARAIVLMSIPYQLTPRFR